MVSFKALAADLALKDHETCAFINDFLRLFFLLSIPCHQGALFQSLKNFLLAARLAPFFQGFPRLLRQALAQAFMRDPLLINFMGDHVVAGQVSGKDGSGLLRAPRLLPGFQMNEQMLALQRGGLQFPQRLDPRLGSLLLEVRAKSQEALKRIGEGSHGRKGD